RVPERVQRQRIEVVRRTAPHVGPGAEPRPCHPRPVPQRYLDQRQDQQRQQLDKAPQARPPGPASLGLGPTCRLLLGAHTLTMDPFGLLAAALLLLTPKAFLLLL